MKNFIVLLMSLMLLAGCKSTSELTPVSQIKPGVAQEGSLANAKLISDAKAGLEKVVGESVNDKDLLKFVIQQPVGEVGSRSWREMWIIKTSSRETQFLMTFKEAGLGAADFEIKPMGDTASGNECPKSVSGFEEGQTNEFIHRCMGKPDNIDKNPDGRYIYFYYREAGVVLTYLFSSENKLMRFSSFQSN